MKRIHLLAAALLLAARAACADPYSYVLVPYFEPGQLNLRLSWGIEDDRSRSAGGQALAFGYTPTSWWYTEFWAAQDRSRGEPLAYDGWYWSNQLRLGSTGSTKPSHL